MCSLYLSLLQIAFFCFYANVKCSQETERRLMELEKIIKVQQNQLDDLSAEKDAEIDYLKKRIHNLEAERRVNREHQVDDDKEDVISDRDADNLKKRRFQPSVNAAFYVYLSGDRCYSKHETFVFDVEETNVGYSYNVNNGIFDVPVSGTYVFSVTIGSNFRTFVTAEIIVNGEVKGTAFANSDEINDIHSATGTIVVQVNLGDRVFVRRGDAIKDCSVRSSTAYIMTTFSGWLLFLK